MTEGKDKKVLVGVVGRLGTGKSTFSKMLAIHGAKLFEADKIAWKLYDIPAVKKDIKETFSKKVFDMQGRVDRKKLGEIVFADSMALRRLNAIVRPPLIGELEYQIARATEKVIVIDAALLLDWPLANRCDLLIAVVADEETSIKRVAEKKMRPNRSRAILSNQRSEEEYRRLCHLVIENNGTIVELAEKAAKVWRVHVVPLTNE